MVHTAHIVPRYNPLLLFYATEDHLVLKNVTVKQRLEGLNGDIYTPQTSFLRVLDII
jgi:hypothetical protein